MQIKTSEDCEYFRCSYSTDLHTVSCQQVGWEARTEEDDSWRDERLLGREGACQSQTEEGPSPLEGMSRLHLDSAAPLIKTNV